MAEAETLKEKISSTCDEFESLVDSDEALASFQQFKKGYTQYLAIYETIFEYSNNGD